MTRRFPRKGDDSLTTRAWLRGYHETCIGQ